MQPNDVGTLKDLVLYRIETNEQIAIAEEFIQMVEKYCNEYLDEVDD